MHHLTGKAVGIFFTILGLNLAGAALMAAGGGLQMKSVGMVQDLMREVGFKNFKII